VKKQTNIPPASKPVSKTKPLSNSKPLLLDRLDNWFNLHEKPVRNSLLAACLLFSFFLFNTRISEGNDDSLYIESGYNYASNFLHYYYTANAPFYPMFLGLIISIIGIKLFWLKITSVLFNFLALLFFYKSFRNRLPSALLFPVLFTIAVNSYFQYFASQTYTEAIFLFVESLFFFYFFKLLDSLKESESVPLKSNYKIWLAVGFLSFFLTMTRNVAAVVLLAMIFYFLLQKKFKYALFSLSAYLLFKIPFEIIKSLIWKNVSQYGSQSNILLRIDPYKGDGPENTEHAMGFVNRFFDNSSMYLSRRFLQILGFMSEKTLENIGPVAVLVILLFAFGLIYTYRLKNNYLFYASIHTLFLAGTTFIVLQQRWDQPRFVMIHIPIILMIIFYGLYQITRIRKSGFGQNLILCLMILIFSSSLLSSLGKTADNLPILSKNLRGDKFYGYTPDWRNFLQMSEWCAGNLPDSALVASRKAPMSFVYGKGKKFFPIYTVIAVDTATGYSNPDTVLSYFRRNKITHVILANLRRDPAKADGNIVNTIHRILIPFDKKFPGKLELIHQIPPPEESQIEPCFLYKINL